MASVGPVHVHESKQGNTTDQLLSSMENEKTHVAAQVGLELTTYCTAYGANALQLSCRGRVVQWCSGGSRIWERLIPIGWAKPTRPLAAHLRGVWGMPPQNISGKMSTLRCILPHSGGSSANF